MRFAVRISASALLAAVALSGSFVAAGEEAPSYQLRYQFQRGDSVYFTVQNDIVRRFQAAGGEVETRDGNDSLKHFKVVSVDANGQAVLELMIDRTRMYAEQKDLFFSYDSATDQTPPDAFAAVHATIGHPWLYVTVNTRGETVDAKTPDGKESIEEFESPDLISRVLPSLPEHEVTVGDIWKESYEVNVSEEANISETEKLKRPIKMQRTYKLASVEGDVATIELSTQVITAKKSAKQEAFLAQGIYFGSMTLDMKRGVLLSRDLHVNQSVIGYDGPGTALSIVLNQKDAFAPQGVSTPLPSQRTAQANSVAAEK